ncbi:hypothetical protein V8C86DRAFT_2510865 [Haematococcus lacustris]
MALTDDNKLEFLPGTAERTTLPSFEWRSLGAAFALGQRENISKSLTLTAARLSGRCGVTVREGFDPVDDSSTGRVVEGCGDVGMTFRKGKMAFSLSAANISVRSGQDDPLAAAQAATGEASVPSLKLTVAKEYAPDSYAGISYDVQQKKPELSLAWAGETWTEKASVVLHADPLYRTYKLSAAVAFPGPDWRRSVVDVEEGVMVDPEDDGGRHRLWLSHVVKDRQWGYRTRLGAAFDLGRLANLAADFVDNHLERHIPFVFWRLPLSRSLYRALVPDMDNYQVRHDISGWDLEVAHEFGQPGALLGLAKHMRYATLRATYDTCDQEAGLQYKRSGVSITANIRRRNAGWARPSLHLHIEPLGLL